MARPIQWNEVKCQYDNLSPCWECTSHKFDAKGYPRHGKNGINTKLCRTMYESENGSILNGLIVRHKCDNPHCINPEHLELGTRKDNAEDRETRGRGRSTLTVNQVLEIKGDNRTNVAIAKDYGISSNGVCNIKKGKRWGWVS